MNNQLVDAIVKKSLELRKTFTPPTHIWKAMDQCGVPSQDASRKELFKAVTIELKREEATQEMLREEEKRMMRAGAKANEMSHPPDTYRNDL